MIIFELSHIKRDYLNWYFECWICSCHGKNGLFCGSAQASNVYLLHIWKWVFLYECFLHVIRSSPCIESMRAWVRRPALAPNSRRLKRCYTVDCFSNGCYPEKISFNSITNDVLGYARLCFSSRDGFQAFRSNDVLIRQLLNLLIGIYHELWRWKVPPVSASHFRLLLRPSFRRFRCLSVGSAYYTIDC